jgi:hypothetical protein
VDWNNDGYHDVLLGDAYGGITVFLNTNDNTNPVLDSGTTIMPGDSSGANFDNWRSAPVVNDWNGDGMNDLLVGHMDGKIEIYLNQSSDASSPVFSTSTYLQVGGGEFDIGSRAAPRIYDWNHDGLNDLLIGELTGHVYFLENTGTNSAPLFDSFEMLLLSSGDPLKFDYANNPTGNPRSRLYVTDWNEDGYDDLIVGGSNGKLELYTSVVPEPMSSTLIIVGGAILGLGRFRKKFGK